MTKVPNRVPDGMPLEYVESGELQLGFDKPKRSWKRWFIIAGVLLVIIASESIFDLYQVNKFYEQNIVTIKSPIIFQLPLNVSNRGTPVSELSVGYKIIEEAQAANLHSEAGHVSQNEFQNRPRSVSLSQLQDKPNIEAVVAAIYQLESSSGKQDGCRKQGLFNGYGYRQNSIEFKCFASHQEVAKLVASWFDDKLSVYTLPAAVCGYNMGFNNSHLAACIESSNNFPYYLNFRSILAGS